MATALHSFGALAVLLLVAAAPEPAPVPDDLCVIVHPALPVQRLEVAEVEALFTSARRSWPNGSAVVAFTYPPDEPLRARFDLLVLRMTPDEVGRFWIDQRIRADRRPPREVADAALALRLVARLPGSISYVACKQVRDNVRVVVRIPQGAAVDP